MVRFVSDVDFRGRIVRGLMLQVPHLNLRRAQDVGLESADDPTILAWAAEEGRIVLTHDRRTMPRFAYDRVQKGQRMAGVVVAPQALSTKRAIKDLRILIECSFDSEWENQVRYLPL